MHRGWGRCGDDIEERIPQKLSEALTGSALETGQKQQRVSVILLIATLGVRRENEQMDGARTQKYHGYLCIQ